MPFLGLFQVRFRCGRTYHQFGDRRIARISESLITVAGYEDSGNYCQVGLFFIKKVD